MNFKDWTFDIRIDYLLTRLSYGYFHMDTVHRLLNPNRQPTDMGHREIRTASKVDLNKPAWEQSGLHVSHPKFLETSLY